jgi:hypothetical protein
MSYLNTPRKRKYTTVNAEPFHVYRRKVWQLLQDPEAAGRLHSITVLRPYDFDESHVDKFRLDARKYRHTALVERETEVNQLFQLLCRHTPHLRFFE